MARHQGREGWTREAHRQLEQHRWQQGDPVPRSREDRLLLTGERLEAERVGTAATNATDALHRCHLALEHDGRAHGYSPEDWMPVIYNGAAPLLEASELDQEPPSLVRHAQEALQWLSRSIACVDEDSRETTAALTDTLARLLVVCVFADAATHSDARGD